LTSSNPEIAKARRLLREGVPEIRIEAVGRGKFQVVASLDGKAVASTTGRLADRKERERVGAEISKDAPGVDLERLLEQLLEAGAAPPAGLSDKDAPAPTAIAIEEDEPSTEAEIEEARAVLRSADLIDQIERDLDAAGIAGESELKLAVYLIATSRVLRRPLHAIVQGESSSGKSYVVEKVAELMPREHVIDATHVSPKALYRMDGLLGHRFLVMGERSRQEGSESEDATKALRELRSRGRLTESTVREGKLDRLTAEGPVASIETTTNPDVFAEDANRCLLLHADESAEQTARVLDLQARELETGRNETDPAIRRRHVAMQRALADSEEPPAVRVPFGQRLRDAIPAARCDVRRTFAMLGGLIRASAVLHRLQRQVDDEGRIVAAIEDYAVAKRVAGPVIDAAIGGSVTKAVAEFFGRLRRGYAVGVCFTTPEAAGKTETRPQRVNEMMKPLVAAGIVEVVEEHRGPRPTEWKLIRSELPTAGAILPDPEALR
jgi:hypothetical protein